VSEMASEFRIGVLHALLAVVPFSLRLIIIENDVYF